jgi:hypothetical protein
MIHLDYQENGYTTGRLSMRSGFWPDRGTRPTMVSILPAFAKDRRAVEDFIADIYARSYGAKISIRYPTLMSVQDESGRILAALGFRNAGEGPLFLEQYLAKPVEHILNVPRHAVTEIGSLASAGGGASLFLFAALSTYLHGQGQDYAVATGTNYLEKRLRTLGLKPLKLAPADPALLLEGDEDWGTYYDTRPNVLAGQIAPGYQRLQKVLGATYTKSRPRLLPRLHYRECQ